MKYTSEPSSSGHRRRAWPCTLAALLLITLAAPTAEANILSSSLIRQWTDIDGRTITGRLMNVNVDDQIVQMQIGRQVFEVPMERLSQPAREWLEVWMKNGQQGATTADMILYVPRLPVRDWELKDRSLIRGRLVGVEGFDVLIDVGGGEVRRFHRSLDLRVTNLTYLRIMTQFGPLEAERPEGTEADELRAMGLTAWRYWDSKGPNAQAAQDSVPLQLYVPKMDRGRSYPLVVFLHGLGEAGTDNVKQLKHRDPLVFIEPESQKQFPCFFLAPQHPQGGRWSQVNIATAGRSQYLVMKAIRRLVTVDYAGQIDPRRIYITGLSSGGQGAVQMSAHYSDLFAAAVPISCRAWATWFEGREVVPMWFFHNKGDDPRVAISLDQFRRDLGRRQRNIRITAFDGRGHNAWRQAYETDGLSRWLFGQRKSF